MTHIDTGNSTSKITPLCNTAKRGDDYVYVDVSDKADLKNALPHITCPNCKQLAEAN